ncbi:MAG: EamA family transporter [Nanoarchaeota archaeon]|nr:EamA family transporter [Nanoarchaeota archaeon]
MEFWFIAALVAALAYGLHNIFTKIAAGHISDALGAFLLEITASVCILLYIFFLITTNEKFSFSSRGVIFSIVAGICVGVGTVLYFYIFSHGGELSIAGPLVLVGGVLLMAVAGIIFFKEKVSLIKIVGITLGIISLWMLKSS